MKAGVRTYVYLGLLALLLANWSAWGYVRAGDFLRVTFFDVGQGDSIFIETPQGHRALIDGGPSSKVVEKVGRKLPFWTKTLDLVILTHPDADHITGLVAALREYRVENVLWTGVEQESSIFAQWKGALEREGARAILARAPQRITWARRKDQFMDVVFPEERDAAVAKSPNELSVAARLIFVSSAFLFTGDITNRGEQALLDRRVNLSAQVLKVPHHGSKTSSSESFVAAVAPSLAIVQVGRNNRYGHPAKEVLERFEALGIPVLRNDLHGDIMVVYDPSKNRTYARHY